MKKSKLYILITLLTVCIASFTAVACQKPVPDTFTPTITIEGYDEYLVAYGDTFTIPKITVYDDNISTLKHTLKVTNNGEEIPVVDGSFVANKAGTNIVTVTATDKAGNTASKQIIVEVTAENELNSFDDEMRIANVTGRGLSAVSLNTDSKYIRYGDGSLKLEVQQHTAESWPGIIVKNLPTTYLLDHYSVSFWMYNDGDREIEIFLQRNELNSKAKFVIPAKVWTKVEVIARNYDKVFTTMKGSTYEPEVGTCEDIKCFTFHFANPADTPTFNVYVDNLAINKTEVNDTLEISADVIHPVVNKAYEMPVATVTYDDQEVTANVTYTVYDKDYNEVTITDNKCTFTESGKYTLIVTAKYGELESSKNYMLVCANSRAENEIEFFEDESSLNFFTSKHFTISYNTEVYHDMNNSTGSMKFHANSGVWPYATIHNVPYADLTDIAYFYFYAKTDYELSSSQTAYLGIRDGGRGKVLKRWSLTNEWRVCTLSVEELNGLGVYSFDGLQLSVELKDPSNPVNQGGWCPVAFNTYIDNFTAGLIEEPTTKEENVVLDFANYRDLDAVYSNGYTTYNFYNPQYTLNNKGSMQVSASAKWPEFKFTSVLEKYSLENLKYLIFDLYIPTIDDGAYVRLGANDSGYQYFYTEDAGKWVQAWVPYSALVRNGATTLSGITFNLSRNDGTTTVNLGTVYIGKITLGYEEKPINFTGEETSEDLKMFTPTNSLYTVAVNTDTNYIVEGETSFKFSATQRWPEWKFSQAFIDWLNEKGYDYISFKVYIDEENSSTVLNTNSSSWAIKGLIGANCARNTWVTVTANVTSLTTSTVVWGLNKNAEAQMYVYIDDVNFYKTGEFTGNETVVDLAMFSLSGNAQIGINYDTNYVKEGDTSLKLSSPSQWPKYTFTQTFIDWLKANDYDTLSFDYYIDNESSSTSVTKLEGVISNTEANKVGNTWISFSISVSSLTTSSFIQFNRPATGNLSVYIDNVQFIKTTAE